MATLASAQITLSSVVDVSAVYRYYLLQSSTLAKPSKPSASPSSAPSGWSDAEPTYTSGSTNSLYTVDGTLFSDGSWSWSDVQLSSSYEAAKTAYNKASAAQVQAIAAARTATDYIGFSESGLVVGDMTSQSLGRNVLIDADSIEIRNGDTVLASYGDSSVSLGANSDSSRVSMAGGRAEFAYSETSPLGEALPGMSVTTSGSDCINVVSAGSGYVRLVSNSDDPKNGAAVVVGNRSVNIGASDGSSDSFGSGGSVYVDESNVNVSTHGSVRFISPNTVASTLSPFQVHAISVYPSAAASLAAVWRIVPCATAYGSSGSLLSASGDGGVKCSRAGKVMCMASLYAQYAASAVIQLGFRTSSGKEVGGTSTNSPGWNCGVTSAPTILSVEANEVVYLMAADWNGSGASVPAADATMLAVWYVE